MDKKIYYIVGSVGISIGGFIPTFFGEDALSIWSIMGCGFGGILAIITMYRLSS